jgi:hypothetical protein
MAPNGVCDNDFSSQHFRVKAPFVCKFSENQPTPRGRILQASFICNLRTGQIGSIYPWQASTASLKFASKVVAYLSDVSPLGRRLSLLAKSTLGLEMSLGRKHCR